MYHAVTDIEAVLGRTRLVELTQDDVELDSVDEAVHDQVAAAATALLNGYIGRRYALPLETAPELVKNLSIELTIVGLYERRFGALPEAIKERKVSAETRCRHIAKGELTLGDQPAPPANLELGARVQATTRTFGRKNLAGW